ncbi:hypothetical protein CANCADRAFT_16479, partial [Tortispora caseinolytica NRRL Y-17796]
LFRPSRIRSLYSDFTRLKEINHDGYIANLEAWKKLILDMTNSPVPLLSHDRTILRISPELSHALFIDELGPPKALHDIVSYLIDQHVIEPLSSYDAHTTPGIIGYLLSSIKGLASGFTQVKLNQEYIIIPKVSSLSTEIFNLLSAKCSGSDLDIDKVFPVSEISHSIKDLKITATDLDICLLYLSKSGKLMYDRHAGVVKLHSKHNITKLDLHIADVKSAILNADTKIHSLSVAISDATEKARDCAEKGNRKEALHILRVRKIKEKSLSSYLNIREKYEEILSGIERSYLNVQQANALESSKAALSQLNSEIGSIENIENLVDDVSEQIAVSDEISHTIAPSKDSSIEEEELEEEFAQLVLEDQRSKLDNLNVPETFPDNEVKEPEQQDKQEEASED